MIATKTPMAALRAHRQHGYASREIPAYLSLGGQHAVTNEGEEARGPRVIKIESAPRPEDPKTL